MRHSASSYRRSSSEAVAGLVVVGASPGARKRKPLGSSAGIGNRALAAAAENQAADCPGPGECRALRGCGEHLRLESSRAR